MAQTAPKSPYGSKPSSLANPVPSPAPEAEDILASLEAAAPAPAEGDALAQLEAPEISDTSIDMEAEATPQPFAPEPDFIQANKEQFENFTTRLTAGLAANDTEKVNYLKQKLGGDNVKYVGDKIYFRRDKKAPFKPFDPDTVELINDFIADNSRAFVQEGYMLPAEVAAGAAGALAPVPGAAPAMVAGSRVAMTGPATQFADAVAAKAGIPQDTERDIGKEVLLQQAFETAIPLAGGFLKWNKRWIPGTEEYVERQALKQGQKAEFHLAGESAELRDNVKQLEESGILGPIDGSKIGFPEANVTLAAHQLHPDNPYAAAAAKLMQNDPILRNFQVEQGKAVRNAILDNLNAIAKKSGAGPVPDSKLGEVLTDAAGSLRKAEGEAIGRYRAKAMAKIGNRPQPIPPALAEQGANLMRELGFTARVVDGRMSFQPPKDLKKQLGKLGITDVGTMRSFVNGMQELTQAVSNNSMQPATLNRIVDRIGSLNPAARRNGGQIASEWGKLSGELRNFRREVIGAGLDEVDRKGFNEVMDSFSAHYTAIDNITDAVNTNMGANAVVKTVFSKGKEGLGDVRALRAVLQKQAPDVWDRVRGEWIDQLVLKHTKEGPTGLNSAAFQKDLQSYGKEFLDTVYEGSESKVSDLMQLLAVGKRIEKTHMPVGGLPQDQKEALMQQTSKVLFASKYLKVNALMSMLGIAKGKNNVLLEILTKDGVDQYLSKMPPKQKAFLSQRYKELVNYAKVNQVTGPAMRAAEKIPKSAKTFGKRSLIRSTVTNPNTRTGVEPVQSDLEEVTE